MWCVAVLEGEGAPPYPASVRPMVLPNPSMLLPFRINNRQGRDMGLWCVAVLQGVCEVVHAFPPSPDHSPRRAAPPPLFHLLSRRLHSDLSDDPAEPTLPHPALLLSLPPPNPPLPYLSPPNLPSPYLPPPSPPSPSIPPSPSPPSKPLPPMRPPPPTPPSPPTSPHPTPTPTTPMTPSSSPIVYPHLGTQSYRRHTPALIS